MFCLGLGSCTLDAIQEYKSKAFEAEYQAIAIEEVVDGETITKYVPITESTV